MQRWSALVEIVKSFNEQGHPRLAFGALALIVIVPAVVIVAAVVLGQPL